MFDELKHLNVTIYLLHCILCTLYIFKVFGDSANQYIKCKPYPNEPSHPGSLAHITKAPLEPSRHQG